MHWHGVHQRGSPWADGTARLTQSAIPPGAIFRYKFVASPPGTHWYHSHVGSQRADGLMGALIVQVGVAVSAPTARHVDASHTMLTIRRTPAILLLTFTMRSRSSCLRIIWGHLLKQIYWHYDRWAPARQALYEQWMHVIDEFQASSSIMAWKACSGCGVSSQGTAAMPMAACAQAGNFMDLSDTPFFTTLANGDGAILDEATQRVSGTPHMLKVKAGQRYRVRTIHAGVSWALKVVPNEHNISIIALDGHSIVPKNATGYIFTPGERVDFIMHANQPPANYWIDVGTIAGYNSPIVLHYEGAMAPQDDPMLLGGALSRRLRLGCAFGMPAPGVVDLKHSAGFAGHPVVSPPSGGITPNKTLVVYMSDNANTAPEDHILQGNNATIPGFKLEPRQGCPALADGGTSKYCW